MAPDINIVSTFLNFLEPHPKEIFAFCFLDIEAKEQIRGLGVKFATAQQITEYLQSDKLRGLEYTLHVTLNHTSTAGRKSKDVQSVRVLCLDLDVVSEKPKIKELVTTYGTHLVIESSPGKYHLYWRIESTIPLDDWKTYQLGLAQTFGGDYGLAQLQHTVRVPGIERLCKDGSRFTPRIVYLATSPEPLSALDIGKVFPGIKKQADIAITAQRAEREKLKQYLKKGDFSKPLDSKLMGRNDRLFSAVRSYTGTLQFGAGGAAFPEPIELSGAMAYGDQVNNSFTEPLGEEECEKTIQSAYGSGVELYARRLLKVEAIGSALKPELDGEDLSAVSVTLSIVPPSETGGFKATYVPGETQNGTNGTNGYHGAAVKIALHTPHTYDYSDPILRVNRFSDMSVSVRVLQRFNNRLARIGDQLYAFDDNKKIWKPQSPAQHPQLLDFLQTACLDTINDPDFIAELCLDKEGEASDSKTRRALDRFTAGRMHSMVVTDVLNSSAVFQAEKEDFDAKEHLLYVKNGVLNMLTGVIRDAQASDYLLNRAEGVSYDAKATSPGWESFIESVFRGNDDGTQMCRFVQELFGYSLSGSIAEQRLFCHYGDGCNGKSKLLSALAKMLGSYATYLEPSELVRAKNGFDTKFERFGAKIEGKRVAIVDDVDVKAVWNEGTVKNLTSDTLRARAEYERSRVVMNRTKMHLGLNVAPVPEAENYGILRRLCFIPYKTTFRPDTATGRAIDSTIKAELPGILNWAIAGYKAFHERGGLLYPAESDLAVEEYRQEHFSIETIIADMFSPVPAGENESLELLTDLTDDINQHLAAEGKLGAKVDVRTLAHAFKRQFGIQSDKRWVPSKGNAFRVINIRRKYERQGLHSEPSL